MDLYNHKINSLKYVDYKDVEMLKKFLTTHARIHSRRKTSTIARSQRKITEAIKRARFMGFLPYISK
ncbi:MAG: 30S ribosomal protein S18 [bacterium]|nr:30S ribosomal protein S18 [bacterium]